MTKVIEIGFPFILITIIVFFLTGGGSAYANRYDTRNYTEVTTGTIVSMDEDYYRERKLISDGYKTMYRYDVVFKYDVDGTRYTKNSTFKANDPLHMRYQGETITVLYKQEDPEHAIPEFVRETIEVKLTFSVIVSVITGIVVSLYFFIKSRG